MMDNLMRETLILSKLNHNNINKIIDDYDDGSNYYIILEYIQGQ